MRLRKIKEKQKQKQKQTNSTITICTLSDECYFVTSGCCCRGRLQCRMKTTGQIHGRHHHHRTELRLIELIGEHRSSTCTVHVRDDYEDNGETDHVDHPKVQKIEPFPNKNSRHGFRSFARFLSHPLSPSLSVSLSLSLFRCHSCM
jgi:hypothetical protein